MSHVLFAKENFKIRQIWPQHPLKHFTAANRGLPPCTQSQHPINRETGYSNVLVRSGHHPYVCYPRSCSNSHNSKSFILYNHHVKQCSPFHCIPNQSHFQSGEGEEEKATVRSAPDGSDYNCEFCFQNSSSIFTFRRPLSVVRPQASHPKFSPLYDVFDHTNHIFFESSWSKDIKTDITKCLIHKYTNTNTQIQHINSAGKTQHVAYF